MFLPRVGFTQDHLVFQQLKLKQYASIIFPGIQNCNVRTIKDIILCFFKVRNPALPVIEPGPPVIRLILYHGIKTVGLHLGHDSHQPHNIGMLAMLGNQQFRAWLDEAFQFREILHRARCWFFLFLCHHSISIPNHFSDERHFTSLP